MQMSDKYVMTGTVDQFTKSPLLVEHGLSGAMAALLTAYSKSYTLYSRAFWSIMTDYCDLLTKSDEKWNIAHLFNVKFPYNVQMSLHSMNNVKAKSNTSNVSTDSNTDKADTACTNTDNANANTANTANNTNNNALNNDSHLQRIVESNKELVSNTLITDLSRPSSILTEQSSTEHSKLTNILDNTGKDFVRLVKKSLPKQHQSNGALFVKGIQNKLPNNLKSRVEALMEQAAAVMKCSVKDLPFVLGITSGNVEADGEDEEGNEDNSQEGDGKFKAKVCNLFIQRIILIHSHY